MRTNCNPKDVYVITREVLEGLTVEESVLDIMARVIQPCGGNCAHCKDFECENNPFYQELECGAIDDEDNDNPPFFDIPEDEDVDAFDEAMILAEFDNPLAADFFSQFDDEDPIDAARMGW